MCVQHVYRSLQYIYNILCISTRICCVKILWSMEHANRMKLEAQEQTKKDADGQQRVATMVDYGILGIALGSSSSSCCYCKLAFYHWLFLNIQQICYRCGFFFCVLVISYSITFWIYKFKVGFICVMTIEICTSIKHISVFEFWK